jgi:hypothetical protein
VFVKALLWQMASAVDMGPMALAMATALASAFGKAFALATRMTVAKARSLAFVVASAVAHALPNASAFGLCSGIGLDNNLRLWPFAPNNRGERKGML